MPYSNVAEMEKSFPSMKNLTPKQKQICLEIFNSAKKEGDDDATAIAKAIGKAKEMSELAEVNFIVLAENDIKDDDIDDHEYEILKVGQYYDSRYGKFSITAEILDTLKKNFDQNVLGIDVAIDTNHDPDKGALAWIKELAIKGDTLVMKIKDITSKGREVLKEKAFKYFSVEYAPFTKVEEGKKTVIPNVLKGVALTNRPVIKSLSPTFLSEGIEIKKDMPIFKTYCENLLKRGKVSADDLALTKVMFEELTPEEQTEAQPEVEKVEAEAATTAEAEAKVAQEAAQKEAEEAKKAEEEAKATQEGAEAIQAAESKRAEAETKLAEANALIAKFEEEKKEAVLKERTNSLILSETNPKGFTKAQEETLKGFIATLSDDQWTQFSEIVGKITKAETGEIGSSGDGMVMGEGKVHVGGASFDVKDADIDAEIRNLAEKEKITYFEAAQKYAESKKS